MSRILLTGKNGQVGWELQRTLATLGEVIALDRHGIDLANPDSIRRAVREYKPNLIVNAAAYTAVDTAEEEPGLAMAINGIAPGILAEEAKKLGATVVHYSTDYVFDGNKDTPYTEEDATNPLNVYGKTKLAGERALQAVGAPHLIFRTSWVYGARGKNFLLTMLRLARERDELRIVNDQTGAPTWSRMIAAATAQILAQLYSPFTVHQLPVLNHPSLFTDISGIYHLSATEETTWFGFTKEILEQAGAMPGYKVKSLHPILTSEYPLAAARPGYAVLSHQKTAQTFGIVLPSWRHMLALCMQEMGHVSSRLD